MGTAAACAGDTGCSRGCPCGLGREAGAVLPPDLVTGCTSRPPLVVSPADGRAPRHRCSPGRVIAGGECGLHWKFIVFMHSHKLMKESRALCESRDLDHFRPRAVIFIRL